MDEDRRHFDWRGRGIATPDGINPADFEIRWDHPFSRDKAVHLVVDSIDRVPHRLQFRGIRASKLPLSQQVFFFPSAHFCKHLIVFAQTLGIDWILKLGLNFGL